MNEQEIFNMFRSVFINRKLAFILASVLLAGSAMTAYAGEEPADETVSEIAVEDAVEILPVEDAVEAPSAERADEPEQAFLPEEDAAAETASDEEVFMTEVPVEDMDEAFVSEIIEEADGEGIIDFNEELFTLEDMPETGSTPTSGKFIHCETAGWTYDSSSGKLTISGSGAIDPYDSAAETPWAVFAGEIKKIEVQNGINSVSSYAFANLGALTEMIVADSVEFISYDAVEGSTQNLIIYGSFGKKAESFAAEKEIRFLPVNITDLSDADITLTPEKYTYNGSECKPSVNVVKSVTTLMEELDYSVSYSGHTEVGTAKVIITGKGNYTGSVERTFSVNAASVAEASVTGLASQTYTGSPITQAPSDVSVGGIRLVAGTDYTVSWNNNINVGTASVIITGKGNYTGSVTKTFDIVKAMNPMTVKGKTASVKYDRLKKKKQTKQIKSVLKLSNNQGNVTFKKAGGNKKITINKKTGKVTIQKGLCKGTYKVKIKIKAAGNHNYKKAEKKVTIKIRVK